MHHRRDEAIIRLTFETGIRIGETITLQVADVDLESGSDRPWRDHEQRAFLRDRRECGATVPQLCICYTLQLGTVSLPKTANPDPMRSNAQLDFEISADDMDALRNLDERDYGQSSMFPVCSGT